MEAFSLCVSWMVSLSFVRSAFSPSLLPPGAPILRVLSCPCAGDWARKKWSRAKVAPIRLICRFCSFFIFIWRVLEYSICIETALMDSQFSDLILYFPRIRLPLSQQNSLLQDSFYRIIWHRPTRIRRSSRRRLSNRTSSRRCAMISAFTPSVFSSGSLSSRSVRCTDWISRTEPA